MNQAELNAALDKSPAERVTPAYIESRIVKQTFNRIEGTTLTLCILSIDNGFEVTGESACVNPENYNKDIGEKIAYDNAFRKLWPLFGFLLAEKNFRSK